MSSLKKDSLPQSNAVVSIARRTVPVMLAAFLAACAVPAANVPSGPETLYVIKRSWHTDIGLSADEIPPPLASLKTAFPGARYLTFGFGERQYLTNPHPTPITMLGALLPSQSALLMTALSDTPQAAFGAGNVVTLHVPEETVARIATAIWRELQPGPDGQPLRLANGPYAGSAFYAASDTYDGLFTCNTWIASTLRAGGLPVPVTMTLFSDQIMATARQLAARQKPAY